MRLFLVRDFGSSDNFEKAELAGQFVNNFFHKNPSNINSLVSNPIASSLMAGLAGSAFAKMANPDQLMQATKLKVRIWNAPSKNARDTAKLIEGISRTHISSIREDVLLGERIDITSHLTDFLWFKQKLENEYGPFRAKNIGGESLFDVACRLRLFFNTLRLDRDDENINDAIIVADADTLNLISMMWLGRTPEWFLQEPKSDEAAIRLLENNEDRGYVFRPPE